MVAEVPALHPPPSQLHSVHTPQNSSLENLAANMIGMVLLQELVGAAMSIHHNCNKANDTVFGTTNCIWQKTNMWILSLVSAFDYK